MAVMETTPDHEVAYQDMVALVRKHEHLSKDALLAIAANMVGKMIALQDQRSMSTDRAMRIVLHNIELGNQQVIAMLRDVPATRA